MALVRSEASIEKAVCEFARARGCMVRKMNGLGFAGWPDRMFIAPRGRVFWIEFKRPGKKPMPIQIALHTQLRERSHSVAVIDDVEEGKQFVLEELTCDGPPTITKRRR